MATNHTENLNLNLWEPQDAFVREEFNENSQKLDAAMTAMEALLAAKGNCSLTIGSYSGSGTYGSASPTSLNLSYQPKLLVVLGYQSTANSAYLGIFFQGLSRGLCLAPGNGAGLTVTWTTTGLKWYADSQWTQLNGSGSVYRYAAFR